LLKSLKPDGIASSQFHIVSYHMHHDCPIA
jgi:hypothetical protein